MRGLIFILFFFLSILFNGPNTYARTCGSPPVEEDYKRSLTVFSGEVVAANSCNRELRVEKVYKGVPGDQISYLDACALRKGKKYIVFAHGDNLKRLTAGGCSGRTQEVTEGGADEVNQFLDARLKQNEALDRAIATHPDDAAYLLRSKAEHLIYWQDYSQIEDTLRNILKLEPNDGWAMSELMHSLFRQQKSQEILDLYTALKKSESVKIVQIYSDNFEARTKSALSLATVQLGKKIEENFIPYLKGEENMVLSDVRAQQGEFKSGFFEDLNFSRANFSAANLTYADLEKLRFYGANFKGADFSSASLNSVDFFNISTDEVEDIKLEDNDFTGANFKSARLKEVNFDHAELAKTDFSDAIVTGATFQGKSDLHGANFNKAKISGTFFAYVSFGQADFTGAEIYNSSFSNSDLRSANLTGAHFKGGEFDCRTQWPEGFNPIKAGLTRTGNCDIEQMKRP